MPIARRSVLRWLALLGAGRMIALPAAAAEEGLLLRARLVWATNGEQPEDKKLEPLPPDIEKRLRRVFKWQHYWQVSEKPVPLPNRKPVAVQMSKVCRLEVAHHAGNEIEIALFGRDKLVVRKRQPIRAGELVVLGGDDKDENAWFVAVTREK